MQAAGGLRSREPSHVAWGGLASPLLPLGIRTAVPTAGGWVQGYPGHLRWSLGVPCGEGRPLWLAAKRVPGRAGMGRAWSPGDGALTLVLRCQTLAPPAPRHWPRPHRPSSNSGLTCVPLAAPKCLVARGACCHLGPQSLTREAGGKAGRAQASFLWNRSEIEWCHAPTGPRLLRNSRRDDEDTSSRDAAVGRGREE